ncbi:MAG: helix-turn-helix domain-containing protein [Eubacteriales bacterium]|nr:helix-turn-helix domain-containing protein [Eubacteriales bacterium]
MQSLQPRDTRTIRLNIQMLADTMEELWWEFEAHRPGEAPCLSGCQIYWGQGELRRDILYLIPQGAEAGFPADEFCYVTTGPLAGDAPHLRRVDKPFPQVANHVMTTFQRYGEFEHRINNIISGGGTLQELCRAASEFFRNPLYIHDNMFSVIAMSNHVDGMLEFEYNDKTQKTYIPLWLIDEFKFDDAYRKTMQLHHAGIWDIDQYPHNMRSLYVNLWDGDHYWGRLLINELGTPLQPGQAWAAEYFGEYIIAWMRSMDQRSYRRSHNFEETLVELMTTGKTNERDLQAVLSILNWKPEEQYLCLKVQNQNQSLSVRSDDALNSRLSSILAGCVTFFYDQQLCAVINMDRSPLKFADVRARLAPLIRDACMYCGISNPISGIQAMQQGFLQADIAMRYIVEEDSSDWLVSFAACALSYIRDRSCGELPVTMVVHPVLLELKAHDQAVGSEYYKTLKVYLRCERSVPLTASALIIHRTTLTYRLGKIQELTRLNLDDASLRLYLLLSFQLLDAADMARHR